MDRKYIDVPPSRRLSLLWLWDSDDDDDNNNKGNNNHQNEGVFNEDSSIQTQYSTPRALDPTISTDKVVEVIDLISPDVSPAGLKPVAYIPRTLSYQHHQQRLSVLPLFPNIEQASSSPMTPVLLLANVPKQQLSIEQSIRRQSGQYPPIFSLMSSSNSADSFMKQKYQHFFESLMVRLHVDMRILDFNYTRMQEVLRLFGDTRIRIFNSNRSSGPIWQLKEEEYPTFLEFYLQMDVDLFYMKTCEFRDAQPRSMTEGLFCLQLPQCRYTMKPCGKCELCHSPPAFVQFNQYQRHRFVNGYEAILNCPASCSSTNMIYVLTCPCEQFDYIGESSQTLAHCLRRHRQLGYLFIHEFLIGEKNRQRAQGIQQNNEMASKNRMRLYQHSIRCSAAMQLFLDCNPQYWPFVPILEQDVIRQNQYCTTTAMGTDRSIEQRLNYVPVPPQGYQFSRRQLAKQYEYFAIKLDRKAPNVRLDLYNAKIIALLPLQASESFRQIVHALFVTHAETKLNTMGHLFDVNTQTNMHNGIWCEHLIRQHGST